MKLLLLAGEESGLLYAREIAARAREVFPNVEIRTYADYGFETHDLAVMGFFAVLRKIFFFLRVKRTMERAIDEWRPNVVCTVDYPGLNLKLDAYAKRRGIFALHVVCPQVWAWRPGRIPKIERALNALCCFFPFEPSLFRPGFATFVGHPLVEAFATASRARDAHSRARVALLPGSRAGEIARLLPTLLDAVKGLDADFVIPAANDRAYAQIDAILKARSDETTVRLQLGGARALLLSADCAVVASGTATLEAALARCPTILVYRVGAIQGFLLRHLIKGVRHVGLANIIWEKCGAHGAEAPMTELLQEDFTAPRVRACLKAFLDDPAARAAAATRLKETCALLSGSGEALAQVVALFPKEGAAR